MMCGLYCHVYGCVLVEEARIVGHCMGSHGHRSCVARVEPHNLAIDAINKEVNAILWRSTDVKDPANFLCDNSMWFAYAKAKLR